MGGGGMVEGGRRRRIAEGSGWRRRRVDSGRRAARRQPDKTQCDQLNHEVAAQHAVQSAGNAVQCRTGIGPLPMQCDVLSKACGQPDCAISLTAPGPGTLPGLAQNPRMAPLFCIAAQLFLRSVGPSGVCVCAE
jgi:hypothetical protein